MLDRDPIKGHQKKVLLLGISYPCVPSQMEKHGFSSDILTHKKPSVEQAVECVRRGILTEMDARDLARCVATEQATNTAVYSASKEIGAIYRKDRHVYANFNARNFCQALQDQFGKDIQFSQVILDYYWMPTGWLVTRWAKTLFQQTLPDLVKRQMLTYPSRRKGRQGKDFLEEGVVYLPFCAHVCKELVGGIGVLEQYYAISFVHKKDLHGHSLWKGTMDIDGDVMQYRLGKRLDQEEVYCTFRPKDIYESMEDSHVSKPAVMRILLAIKDYDNIRMVKLRPLRQHERASVFRERLYNDEVGGFIGLDFDLSARLQKELKKGRKKTVPAIEEEKKEEDVATIKTSRNGQAKKTSPKKSAKKDVVKDQYENDDEEEESEEHERFMFYPGPAKDIETYNEPEEMEAEDLKAAKAERMKRAAAKQARAKKSPGLRKGIVVLPGDEKIYTDSSDDLYRFEQPSDYLAFNPRQRPLAQTKDRRPRRFKNSGEETSQTLNWSLVEGEDDEDKMNELRLAPEYERIQAASTLFFGVKKVLNSRKKNQEVARVSSLRGVDSILQNETACYSVDLNRSEYQTLTGYDIESKEKLMEMGEPETPLQTSLMACRGEFERLLEHKEQTTIKEYRKRIISNVKRYKKSHVASSVRERFANLSNIARWLILGRRPEDDFSGCFQFLENRLADQELSLSKNVIEIEKTLWNAIRLVSETAGAKSSPFYDDEVLGYARRYREFIEATPLERLVVCCNEGHNELLDREKDRSELRRRALAYLRERNSGDDAEEFRTVDIHLANDLSQSEKDRAVEIAARVEVLRNLRAWFIVNTAESTESDKPRQIEDKTEQDFYDAALMMFLSLASTGENVPEKKKPDTSEARSEKKGKKNPDPEGSLDVSHCDNDLCEDAGSPLTPRRLVSPSSTEEEQPEETSEEGDTSVRASLAARLVQREGPKTSKKIQTTSSTPRRRSPRGASKVWEVTAESESSRETNKAQRKRRKRKVVKQAVADKDITPQPDAKLRNAIPSITPETERKVSTSQEADQADNMTRVSISKTASKQTLSGQKTSPEQSKKKITRATSERNNRADSPVTRKASETLQKLPQPKKHSEGQRPTRNSPAKRKLENSNRQGSPQKKKRKDGQMDSLGRLELGSPLIVQKRKVSYVESLGKASYSRPRRLGVAPGRMSSPARALRMRQDGSPRISGPTWGMVINNESSR